jgi:UTP-glucose-1-phosphate uridylyltransferase
MEKKTVLIMAAGSGSRYGGLKQFDELGPKGEFLFEFNLYDALQNGFNHVVVITKGNLVNDIQNYLKKRMPKLVTLDVVAQEIDNIPANITLSLEREKPWGTSHAVWVAKDVISNPFIVINADDYYGKNAFRLASEFLSEGSKDSFGMVPYFLKNTLSLHGSVSRGVCVVESNELLKIEEYKELEDKNGSILDVEKQVFFTGNELVSMNFWICNPAIFEEIEAQLVVFLKSKSLTKKQELLLPDTIQKLISGRKAKVFLTAPASSWFGVTYAEDKERTVHLLQELSAKNNYPSPLWNM